jgi:hypothetical protein
MDSALSRTMSISFEDRNGRRGVRSSGFSTPAPTDLGEPSEEMRERGGELVATNEPTVVTEPLFDPIVVENGQGDGGLANSAGTDESDRSEVFCESNDLLDQLVASKAGPRWWWWGFSWYARWKCQTLDLLAIVEVADLVRV